MIFTICITLPKFSGLIIFKMSPFCYRGRVGDRRRSPPRYSRSPRHSRSPPPRHATSRSHSRDYYSPPKRRHPSRFAIITLVLVFFLEEPNICLLWRNLYAFCIRSKCISCSKLFVKHCQGFLFSSVFYISSLVSYLLYLFSLYAPKLNWPV